MDKLSSLDDALIFLLNGLYDAEQQVSEALPHLRTSITSPRLALFLDELEQSQREKLEKLKAVFSTLHARPSRRQHRAVESVLDDTFSRISRLGDERVRHEVVLSSLLDVDDYKNADYSSAHHFALIAAGNTVAGELAKVMDIQLKSTEKLAEAIPLIMEEGPVAKMVA